MCLLRGTVFATVIKWITAISSGNHRAVNINHTVVKKKKPNPFFQMDLFAILHIMNWVNTFINGAGLIDRQSQLLLNSVENLREPISLPIYVPLYPLCPYISICMSFHLFHLLKTTWSSFLFNGIPIDYVLSIGPLHPLLKPYHLSFLVGYVSSATLYSFGWLPNTPLLFLQR